MKFKWKKLGRVFDPSQVPDRYFIKAFAQAPSTIIFDDFVRVYFSCRPEPDANGQYVSYSAYVDLDRKNLMKVLRFSDKPILELGEKGAFDEFGTYPVSVIKRQDEYWAYYAGWTRCESVPFNVAIGLAISKNNGETFKRLGPGPILSYTPNEPFILSGPKIRFFNNKYYLFYIAGKEWVSDKERPEPVYTIRLATSDDGLKWEKLGKELIKPKLEPNEAQASPDVIYASGLYHMFFCYRYSTNYRNRERGYRIGYAHSLNLTDWERNDELVGITVSEEGWDHEMVSYPHILNLDGKTYMFYLGNQVGKTGFGIAVLENEII